MTPLDLITRRQYLEEELALAAATHQHVLDGPTPTKPADRDARDALLDRLRTRWTDTLDCLTRHTDPARGDPLPRAPPRPRCEPPSNRRNGRSSTTKAATPSRRHTTRPST